MPEEKIDYREFVLRLSLAALQVGVVALQFYGKVANIGKEVSDTTGDERHRIASAALSDVDLVAQDIVLHAAYDRYPFIQIEPEEDTPLVSAFAGNRSAYTLVLDPIDGTLNYLTQAGQFAVAIGLLREDRFDAAVVYFPLLGEIHRAIRGEGAEVVKTAGARDRVPRDNVVFRGSVAPDEALRNLEAAGYELERSGCSLVDSTVVSNGLGLASVCAREPSIRRCIGTIVAAESGGHLCDLEGRPYDCTRPEGLSSLVVAPDAATADIIRRAFAPDRA